MSDMTLDELLESTKPLTERDMVELDGWVRGQFVRMARASLSDEEIGSRAWDATMRIAMRDSLSLTWSRRPGVLLFLRSDDGLAKLLVQGRSDVTRDEVLGLFKTSRDKVTALEEFLRINGMRMEGAEQPAGPT